MADFDENAFMQALEKLSSSTLLKYKERVMEEWRQRPGNETLKKRAHLILDPCAIADFKKRIAEVPVDAYEKLYHDLGNESRNAEGRDRAILDGKREHIARILIDN